MYITLGKDGEDFQICCYESQVTTKKLAFSDGFFLDGFKNRLEK
jgi:hypothetical protein